MPGPVKLAAPGITPAYAGKSDALPLPRLPR